MYFYLLQNKKRMRKNNNLRVTNTSWPLLDLAVVGVLHQQHHSTIENQLQKNKCQM
jgi:hypothetical protein